MLGLDLDIAVFTRRRGEQSLSEPLEALRGDDGASPVGPSPIGHG